MPSNLPPLRSATPYPGPALPASRDREDHGGGGAVGSAGVEVPPAGGGVQAGGGPAPAGGAGAGAGGAGGMTNAPVFGSYVIDGASWPPAGGASGTPL